jgi:methylated-DNA-[protein]-cysteine S-methyltransferase
MNDWVYVWNTRTTFDWAALGGGLNGARWFDFGFAAHNACLENARGFLAGDDAQIISKPVRGSRWLPAAVSALNSYFTGKNALLGMPLDWAPYTSFKQSVWSAAMTIPYGEIRSYAWLASQIETPGAARAVGSALGANPLPVIVPCHRIVRTDGTLGGFGMGLEMKERLLELEQGH